MHYSINPEINLGRTVTNIWNIKQYRTKQPLPMLFVELKPVPNNKGHVQCRIYTAVQNEMRTAQTQNRYCTVKCEPPKHKTDIAQ
jgi:hypothetical protein